MKRLGIYTFFDKDGIVDDYVTYFLSDYVKNFQELIIICNGKLTVNGRKKLTKYTPKVIARDNKGFDIWGYKTGLDYYGWNKLGEYDEVVVANDTMMGPIYPFSEMFEEMDKKKLDFWGMTKHYSIPFDPFNCNPYGYIPEHVQSYFMAFRKSFIQSEEFQQYWNNFPELCTYEMAVGKHESYFTKYFSEMGFSYDTYVQTDDLKDQNYYPLMIYPTELIRDRKCPIFKRRTFFHEHDYFLGNSTGQVAQELYEYLRKETSYDTNMIWNNLLRTCNQADIAKNLNLAYILPSNLCNKELIDLSLKEKKIALVMHLYFKDLINNSLHYAMAMPEWADIYITTDKADKKEAIENAFKVLKCHKLDVRLIENRGRDVSSILVGVKDVIMDYDYACFVHDKKTAQVKPGSIGESFGYKCFENTLHNQEFVYNVLQTFEENPRLGILSPPEPNHADFFPTLGHEWAGNFAVTEKLAQKLDIKVPMSEDKEPIAPLGTFFWFRPVSFKDLYDKDWDYKDFPEEPNGVDGTLLHAIERIYPYAVQQAGYYPATVMVDTFARIEYTNLRGYTRGYTKALVDNGIFGYSQQLHKIVMDLSAQNPGYDYEYSSLRATIENLEKEKKNLISYVDYLEKEVIPNTSIKRKIKDKLFPLVKR